MYPMLVRNGLERPTLMMLPLSTGAACWHNDALGSHAGCAVPAGLPASGARLLPGLAALRPRSESTGACVAFFAVRVAVSEVFLK